MSLARVMVSATVVLIGCGAGEPLVAPRPLGQLTMDPPQPEVVVCPVGSAYDAARHVCVATQSIAQPDPEPEPEPPPAVVAAPAEGGIRVTCGFANGWVSVMPVSKYPRDDQFLMQALIGLTDEPQFWKAEREYAPLAPYAAKKCGSVGVRYDVPAGSYFVLAGESGTFAARGSYTKNGFRKKVQLDPASPLKIDLKASDLTHTWLCISCPFVAFFDPAKEGGGRGEAPAGGYLPSFVVLANRRSRADKGTDRIPVSGVPVKGGRVRLRVVEAEREVTHLDRLALEIDGVTVLPLPGSRSALAAEDGVEVEMARGRVIELSFDVSGKADGTLAAVVVATGYYEPRDD